MSCCLEGSDRQEVAQNYSGSESVQTLEILWAPTGNLPEVTSSTPSISSALSISSPLGQVEFLRRSTGPIRKPGFSLLQSSRTERRLERATRLQPTPRETSFTKTVSSSGEIAKFHSRSRKQNISNYINTCCLPKHLPEFQSSFSYQKSGIC